MSIASRELHRRYRGGERSQLLAEQGGSHRPDGEPCLDAACPKLEEVRVLRSLGYMPPRREWTLAELGELPRTDGLRMGDTRRVKTKARALREAVGLSLRQVAQDLDYDKGAMSRLETGERAWTLRMALSWLDYMGLAVARARREGLPLQDDAIPTLRELALGGPDDERKRRSRRKGGHRARGKVRGRARV